MRRVVTESDIGYARPCMNWVPRRVFASARGPLEYGLAMLTNITPLLDPISALGIAVIAGAWAVSRTLTANRKAGLAGTIRPLHDDMTAIKAQVEGVADDVTDLRERMARIEGYLSATGKVAKPLDGPPDTR